MKSESPPRLQPPGAGLPWYILLAARYLIFPTICRKTSWQESAALFQTEGSKVLELWETIPEAKLTEKFLVPRLQGLEDSSRYWSVAMTVEHLNIVGDSIREMIQNLRDGETPKRIARTEDVKPQGKLSPAEVRSHFVQLLANAEAEEKSLPPIPRGSGGKTPHPWFGPLDSFQWHCLLGMHQQIHRRQIEEILSGLKK